MCSCSNDTCYSGTGSDGSVAINTKEMGMTKGSEIESFNINKEGAQGSNIKHKQHRSTLLLLKTPNGTDTTLYKHYLTAGN